MAVQIRVPLLTVKKQGRLEEPCMLVFSSD